MIYLYGLLAPGTEGADALAQDLTGVTGPLALYPLGPATLIAGPHDGADILPKRRFLLAHARVLEAFQDLGTVLPMRFGMAASDVDSVERMIARQAEQIAEQFDRLTGLVEVGLRINYDRESALAHQLTRHEALQNERDALMKRRAGQFEQAEFGRRLGDALDRHRTEVQHALAHKLRAEITDLVLRAPEEDVQVLAADLLLARDQVDGLPDLLTALLQETDFGGGSEPQIKIVGPGPAYSFTRITLSDVAELAA